MTQNDKNGLLRTPHDGFFLSTSFLLLRRRRRRRNAQRVFAMKEGREGWTLFLSSTFQRKPFRGELEDFLSRITPPLRSKSKNELERYQTSRLSTGFYLSTPEKEGRKGWRNGGRSLSLHFGLVFFFPPFALLACFGAFRTCLCFVAVALEFGSQKKERVGCCCCCGFLLSRRTLLIDFGVCVSEFTYLTLVHFLVCFQVAVESQSNRKREYYSVK